MKIYTRKGDTGTTGLLYGGRIGKDSPAIVANGAVDEAQAALGGIAFEGTFEVPHIDLVRSEPSPQGHRYTTVTRARLGGAV